MTSSLKLRTLSHEQARLHRRVAVLEGEGHAVQLREVAVPSAYVAFEAAVSGRAYEGWISVAAALRRRYPGLDELAWRAIDVRYLLDALDDAETFETLPAPAGGWERVKPVAIVTERLETQPLLCFDSELPTYFRDFPAPSGLVCAPQADACAAIPVTLRFRAGTSLLPAHLLSRIAIGDALLIQRAEPIVTIGGKPLFRFQQEGEEIVLDEQFDQYEEDYLSDTDDDTEHQTDTAEETASDAEPFSADALPVRLEFVLQEQSLSFADLAHLRPGVVLPMQTNAAANVKVRANGRLVATGELIQVGEQLAVQVQSVRLTSNR